MEVESIEELDGTVERGGYQTNVSDVCNACDFGTFILLLYGLSLFVLVFFSSALLTLFILLELLDVSREMRVFAGLS